MCSCFDNPGLTFFDTAIQGNSSKVNVLRYLVLRAVTVGKDSTQEWVCQTREITSLAVLTKGKKNVNVN